MRFNSPLLRDAWQLIWFPEFSSIFMLMTISLLHQKRAGYVVGGSMKISRALEKRYLDLGGEIHYNSRVDTRDFLERLMGFGRIIIIFKDRKRQPLVMLVWRIHKKAARLEAIRGTISVEQHRPPVKARLAPGPEPTETGDEEPPTQA